MRHRRPSMATLGLLACGMCVATAATARELGQPERPATTEPAGSLTNVHVITTETTLAREVLGSVKLGRALGRAGAASPPNVLLIEDFAVQAVGATVEPDSRTPLVLLSEADEQAAIEATAEPLILEGARLGHNIDWEDVQAKLDAGAALVLHFTSRDGEAMRDFFGSAAFRNALARAELPQPAIRSYGEVEIAVGG